MSAVTPKRARLPALSVCGDIYHGNALSARCQ